MFKFIALASLLFACTLAHPQQPAARPQQQSQDGSATVVTNTYSDDGAGNFKSDFETSNGIKQQSAGQLKDITVPISDASGQKTGDQPGKGEVQSGSFSYPSPDGTVITLQWVADENGFQPQGTHLPVAPTVPKN